MARTALVNARLDPALIEAAREAQGLAGEPVSVVIRYALALAGRLDPAGVAVRPGRPRTRREPAAA